MNLIESHITNYIDTGKNQRSKYRWIIVQMKVKNRFFELRTNDPIHFLPTPLWIGSLH